MAYANFTQAASDCGDDLQLQLCAYNTAFEDLELSFRFDAATLASLATIEGDESARLSAFIARNHPHLLNAYSADFLCDVILEKKNEHYMKCTTKAGNAEFGSAYGASQLAQRGETRGASAHR